MLSTFITDFICVKLEVGESLREEMKMEVRKMKRENDLLCYFLEHQPDIELQWDQDDFLQCGALRVSNVKK